MTELRTDLFAKIMQYFVFLQIQTGQKGIELLHDIVEQATGQRKRLSECSTEEMTTILKFMTGEGCGGMPGDDGGHSFKVFDTALNR